MIPTQEDEEELPIITADMTEREKAEFYMRFDETHPCDPIVSPEILRKSALSKDEVFIVEYMRWHPERIETLKSFFEY